MPDEHDMQMTTLANAQTLQMILAMNTPYTLINELWSSPPFALDMAVAANTLVLEPSPVPLPQIRFVFVPRKRLGYSRSADGLGVWR